MKDRRFVELVNGYLDGEISGAETVELEQEIRSSAGRMEQYRRYCRMQKACLLLAQQSRSASNGPIANVVRLPDPGRRWAIGQWLRGGIYAGTAAIAASVILVISLQGPVQQPPVAIPMADFNTQIVQIPVGEFSPKRAAESRLATLKDRWSALTARQAQALPAAVGPMPPVFTSPASVGEWTAVSAVPSRGPIEFRYKTDSFSGARVLHGQPRIGEPELATFQFAR